MQIKENLLTADCMMEPESDGEMTDFTEVTRERKKRKIFEAPAVQDKYSPFIKKNYKRLYPDKSSHTEFAVFLESTSPQEQLGNKDPISVQKLITKFIKGQYEMNRASAQKLKIIFKQATDANDLLSNEHSLEKIGIKAFIPASFVEKIGVIQHVSTELSNEELFRKLSGENEIVAVRRFMKKVDGEMVPLKTVTVTFVTGVLPQCIYLDHWRMPVNTYVPPVMQCYRCMKFNHTAKVCKNQQVCSVCSGDHQYKDCTNEENIKCSNCGGAHLAISKLCPLKMQLIAKQKQSIQTYANVIKDYNKSFPALPVRQQSLQQTQQQPSAVRKLIIRPKAPESSIKQIDSASKIDDNILNAMVKTLVFLGNSSENIPMTSSKIKEILLKNLTIPR